ncbi:TonB-dependent receptor [Sphingomonas soli]|uniref:TonB-dependent receptor n=1 Tax=Sphingomonas soli TaxID=266127 RepID=UPI00082BC199|nr:TonB-dependent receptor [Sphingomonas soli]
MGRFGHLYLGTAGVAAIALVASLPACAQADAPQRFTLPAQDLGAAIRAIALSSGQTVVAPTDLVRGLRAPAIDGTYTPEEAVALLLRGTDLRVARVGNALVIQRQPAESASDAQGEAEGAGDEAILVTGTRIRGRAPAGASVHVIDREAIDRSGYATTQQILQTLPQNFGGGPNETTIETNRGNAGLNQTYGSGINLRGLGSSSTLILLGGERPPMGGFAGIFTDLSMVPTVAIERIEVLPDGASALYGSDAVAGVVNIVPRLRFDGIETGFRYGRADGFDEVQANGIAGTHWSSGRLVVSYEYYQRGRFAAADRPYVSEDLRPLGGGDYRGLYANPGTIVAGGRTYAIPAGQNGQALPPGSLVAGTLNRGDQWAAADVLPEQRRHAVFGAISQSLGPSIELYAQALFGDRRFDKRLVSSINNAARTVPVANPFYVDPIGTRQPVQVRYSFVRDLGPESTRGSARAFGGTFGARATLGAWQLDLHGGHGVQDEHWRRYNLVNTARLAQALADPNPATAYNLFGDGPNTNPATIERVRGSTSSSGRYTMWTAQLRADGPLFALPGGQARLAVGGEYRRERYRDTGGISDRSSLTPQPLAVTPFPDGREVTAGYAELSLPLASPELGVPALHRLELSAAVRAERYSDFGDTTNPKLGLTWEPVVGLGLRGTYGTSFRAPSFDDVRQDPANIGYFAIELADPAAPGGATTALIIRGNDPDMRPERATTWTVGIDLNPKWLDGFHGRLTWFDIRYRDRIASPSADVYNFLVKRAIYAPIIDAAPSRAAIDAYYASPYFLDFFGIPASQVTTVIDARNQNLSLQHLTGLDFDLGYSGSFLGGTAEVGVSGSYLLDFKQALTADAPAAEFVDTLGYPVDLRLRGRLSWSGEAFGAALSVNYIDGYTNRTQATVQRVDAWTTLDLQLSYRFPQQRGPLAGLRLSLSATNLLDADPPFTVNALGSTTIGYDPENGNAIGRLIAFQVSKRW